MTVEMRVSRGRRDVSNAWQHPGGSFLIPLPSPPSWAGSGEYCYLCRHLEDFDETFDSLRCLRFFDHVPRGEWRKIVGEGLPDRSVIVAVTGALETPSGFVVPWEIRVGDERFASLHPPPWLTFAPDLSYCSVSSAVHRVSPEALEDRRELRRGQVERAMRSAPLLDRIRRLKGRRMNVQWFDGDKLLGDSAFDSGRELFESLIDASTRNRPHLIQFPNGWSVDGLPWYM